MKDAFSSLIGQESVKNRLSFYIEAFQKTHRMPAMLFSGQKGIGKTEFAKTFSNSLKIGGAKKEFIEINCSTIKDLRYFFDQIYYPRIRGKNVSLLLDEAHCLPQDVTAAFLTIFNTENIKVYKKDFDFDGNRITFDFSKLNVIFATTETNKIFPALKDRFVQVDFEPYSSEELAKIVLKNVCKIRFSKSALDNLSKTIRSNARNAMMRANEIQLYCAAKRIRSFGDKHFKDFLNRLGILPLGLTSSEFQILKILSEKEASLGQISASTGISRAALQRDHEMFLLQRGLVEIDGKRKITYKGREALEEIEKFKK